MPTPDYLFPVATIAVSLGGSLVIVSFTAGRIKGAITAAINGHSEDISETRRLAESTNTTVTEMRIDQEVMRERQIHFETRLQNVELDR